MEPKESFRSTDLAISRSPIQKRVLDLSIIVPTRNEAGNINILLTRINRVLHGLQAEVIFVDDSTDETPHAVEASKQLFPGLTIRLLHRTDDQRSGGLGGAVLVEKIIGWGGLGQYSVDVIVSADYFGISGAVLMMGTFSLLIYLLIDLSYFAIDPRVKV